VALAWLLRARPAELLSRNYRGATVIGRGGVTLAASLAAAVVVAVALRPSLKFNALELYCAGVSIGIFGLLGWLDDARGTPDVRGMQGHLALLVKYRRVSTGLVKAGVGAAVGLWAGYLLGASGWAVLPAGAVVALSANAVNALDARPGRAGKGFVVAAIGLLAASLVMPFSGPSIALAALLGGVLVFAPADLSERAMLGDTGANPLGCALGLAVVGLTGWPAWVGLSLLLLAFCLAADHWSLTRTIESSPVLRRLDELGLRPGPPARKINGN
jgi:UDP-N-acetylmuramyl pentapeptide phosphotransferase/UDP-N-acetylglucosamine-1-phosphate transferase